MRRQKTHQHRMFGLASRLAAAETLHRVFAAVARAEGDTRPIEIAGERAGDEFAREKQRGKEQQDCLSALAVE